MKNNKKYVYSFLVLAVLAILATATPVIAAAPAGGFGFGGGHGGGLGMGRGNIKPGVFGTVSAVSGNIITVTGRHGLSTNAASTSTTTYTVDATNATITKNGTTGSISSILVGDTIMAQGTLTGTNLIATTIRDGQMGKGLNGGSNGTTGNQSSPITGNGQPVIAGAVTSISGSTLMITNKSNVSYTVDATNAKIVEGQSVISISSIIIGDNVIVQGTVNGNSVVASSVIDQKTSTAGTINGGTNSPAQHQGFFGAIGSFFAHIFGF